MYPSTHPELPFRWLGGRLCLDFANTVAWSAGPEPGEPARPRTEYERLTRYARLVAWGQEAGVLSDGQVAALMAEAARNPDAAQSVLADAITLREAIHRLFVAVVDGCHADLSPLATLNAVVARGLARRRLATTDTGFAWTWSDAERSLEVPLWSVALSAAELLVSADLHRVRRCGGEDCGFLFLDTGRGPGRRWCDMAHCGNREKARRHYRRARAALSAPDSRQEEPR